MKIYKLERTDEYGYDEYDSMVVIASSKHEALRMCPSEMYRWDDETKSWYGNYKCAGPRNGERYEVGEYHSWVSSLDKIECTLIGEVDYFNPNSHVVVASFNAG